MIANITILTEEEHDNLITRLGLKLDATIQSIIIAICTFKFDNGAENVTIDISTEYFAESYRRNPAMFATTSLRNRTEFPQVRSRLKSEGVIQVIASSEKIPTTFRAKAIQSIRENGVFSILKRDIPKSYRHRLPFFTSVLVKATGLNILCKEITDKKINWKVK